MWCANCRADVAAEVTADNKRIRCAICGTHLETPPGQRLSERAREARQLLERWSIEPAFDPYSPLSGAAPVAPAETVGEPSPAAAAPPVAAGAAVTGESSESARRTFRVDRSHNAREAASDEVADAATAAPVDAQTKAPLRTKRRRIDRDTPPDATRLADRPSRPRRSETSAESTESREPTRVTARVDAAHAADSDGPHFDVQGIVQRSGPRRPNSTSLAGQFLAYGGVLGLTVGTAMVVWGYFGGPAHFAPTGWLITTAGQMLLFLGVVTLVSGGMEQTTDEVSRRIEWLGDRLIRIEHASRDHALRGPSIPAERFAGEAAPADESQTVPAARGA